MWISNGIGVLDVEHEEHFSHVRRAQLEVQSNSLIEALVGYLLDLGDFKREVVWRYMAAHITRQFCQVFMSMKDCELYEFEKVYEGGWSVEIMPFAGTLMDQRLLKAIHAELVR